MGRVRNRRVDEGTDARLEQLYREHAHRMWRALLAFTNNTEIASDAVAEAFAQALRRGDAIRDPERWIWRAAYRIAAGELKERGRMGAAVIERSCEIEEPALDLIAALAHLSPKQRAAVVLHHAVDLPVAEIATIISSTSTAVRVHLSRGRARLRERLEDDRD